VKHKTLQTVVWWAFSALCEYAIKHKKYSYEPKGRGFESLLARQRKASIFIGAFLFFVFNRQEGREQGGRNEVTEENSPVDCFSPTGQGAKRRDRRGQRRDKVPLGAPKLKAFIFKGFRLFSLSASVLQKRLKTGVWCLFGVYVFFIH